MRFVWFYEMLWIILLFNRIRYETKINIKLRGCFEILESFGGERVNKKRFDGSINKEIRSELCFTYGFGKREKTREIEEEPRRAAISAKLREGWD